MRILFDLDGTVINMLDEWLARYNREYNDSIKHDDIKEYNINGWRTKVDEAVMSKYLEDPTLYDNALPYDGAVETIHALQEDGHYIVFATVAYHKGKYAWFERYGVSDIPMVVVPDKNLIKGDILVDDCFTNVKAFENYGILIRKPWNEQEKFTPTVDSLRDVIDMIGDIEALDTLFENGVEILHGINDDYPCSPIG